MAAPDASTLLDEARREQSRGDIAGALASARGALEADESFTEAMEFLALALVARRHAYADGLTYADAAVVVQPEDAGLWYTRGWCYEFAGHELRRGRRSSTLNPRDLYVVSRESFQRCLALHPDGKLADDAADLLDHVENELAGM